MDLGVWKGRKGGRYCDCINFLLFLSLSNNGFGGTEGEKGGSIL